MIFRRYLTALALLIITTGLSAQDFAIKSNVLYDVTKTLNAGIEIGGGRPELTFDISGSYCLACSIQHSQVISMGKIFV